MNEKPIAAQDDEISLLDLMVVVAENWLWLFVVPIIIGVATYVALALGGSEYRASLAVPIPAEEVLELWQESDEIETAVPIGLAADGAQDGVTIQASEDGSQTTLTVTRETRDAARSALELVADFIAQSLEGGTIEDPENRYLARIADLEAMISLRTEMISALEARLTDDTENSEYALSALALAQLLEGRAAELNRLETFRAETPEPYVMPQELAIEVDRIGRSPLLLSVLVFLGSGFVVLIVVFVGQGLKAGQDDPITRAKLQRIRNGFLLRRRRT